ncbi:hypothetical protein [Megasphaera stantonii]|uniref:hypothetical protein n=1 Tax=Megasphaera stantonii TaxID=2144175 RepID=UPI001D93C7EA|nr:hypothetical protein [Megasphaera stantonii]HJE83192.1 hypothetical protein [Megasphaera stantonii]
MPLLTAPTPWLHDLAKGPIKTNWGKLLKADDPAEAMDKEFHRLKKEGYNLWATSAYLDVGLLLAERLAIAEYKLKNPMITPVAPEVLSYQEALELALKEYQAMSREDLQTLLKLLQTDELMKPIE